MSRIDSLEPFYVEFIPERVEPGILYIAITSRFSTAIHLCCCGCGLEVVTPINPSKWKLIKKKGKVSLSPSIGNWSFPCQSHYWIVSNQVCWAKSLSSGGISLVKERDRIDVNLLEKEQPGVFHFIFHYAKTLKEKLKLFFLSL